MRLRGYPSLQPEQSPQQKPDPVVQEEAQVAQAPQHGTLPRVLLLAVLGALLRAEGDEAAFRAGRDLRGRISESGIDLVSHLDLISRCHYRGYRIV